MDNNLLICLRAVSPVFLMLTVGYVSRCCHIINSEDVAKMNKIAFKVFLPVLLFNNIYQSELSYALRPKLIAFSVISVLVVTGISTFYTLHKFKDKPDQQGVIIQGLFRSNFVVIGLPIASALVGGDGSVVSVLIAIIVPIFNVLAVICLGSFNGEKASPKKLFYSILKNPLIIASIAGIVFLLFGLRLPKSVASVVSNMGTCGSVLMLFLLGAFFRFDRMACYFRQLTVVCLGRLVVIPGVILALGYGLGFRGVEFVALIGAFASAASVSSFTMAQQMGGDANLAGSIIVVTSALCPFTVFLWSFLFKTLGAF